jgi:hypothetical protein
VHGRKPIRAEWKIFEQNNLDSREWLVQKVNSNYLQIINKTSGEVKTISTVIVED